MNKARGSLPCREAAGESAVKAFAAALVGGFLLPEGHVGAVVAGVFIERRQRSADDGVGRLVLLQVGLEGGARTLGVRHFRRELQGGVRGRHGQEQRRKESAEACASVQAGALS